ncbi:Ion-translocating oxidoreductase complex subunit B [subsurface metagenome]
MEKKADLLALSQDTGTIPKKELEASPGYPSKGDLNKGPLAVIECTEEIPCNPCETVCNKEAIVVGEPITNLPRVDPKKCNGCGLCIPICPGLAIFLVDTTYSEDEATISFPHEYLPLPKEGDQVEVVNRKGETVYKGKVLKVRSPKSYDHTPVVTVAAPKKYIHEVRGIKPMRKG